jgi:hypothetical protein
LALKEASVRQVAKLLSWVGDRGVQSGFGVVVGVVEILVVCKVI